MSFNKIKSVIASNWLIILTAILLSSCARPDITIPKSKYDSDTLSKDWRSNIIENQKLNNNYRRQPQTYAYPADNDADYIAPKYEYRYVPVQPQRQPQPYNPYPYNAPYPQDNDAQYAPRYPTYDPDADNSGYYILNKNKRLPPPVRKEANEELYDYPIYFD